MYPYAIMAGNTMYLYFASDRSGDFDIWYSTNTGAGWSTPSQIGLTLINQAGSDEIAPHVRPDLGEFYFSSNRSGAGFDLYVSLFY